MRNSYLTFDKMNGFINDFKRKKRFPYVYEDGVLAVFSKDTLPLDDNVDELILTSKTQYTVGNDLQTGYSIIFFVDALPFSDCSVVLWTSTTSRVLSFIATPIKLSNFSITTMDLDFAELNVFYPLSKKYKIDSKKNNEDNIEISSYDKTKVDFNFMIDSDRIDGEFGVLKKYNGNDATSPIELSAVLSYNFEKTTNIDLLFDIYKITKRTFCFLCHRRSIEIKTIDLTSTNVNGDYVNAGIVYILYDKSKREENDIIKKTIKYGTVKSHFSELVQLVADDKLYFEHIPTNDEELHLITVSDFILEAAAFEWTFKQCYGKIPLSEYRQEVKTDILSCIDGITESKPYNSKKKSELKLYRGIVERVDRSLSESILYALKDFDDILVDFIKQIFGFNNMKYTTKTYSDIAKDLERQRNAYAHGNIDKEMTEHIVSNTIILMWLNCAMVLKQVGYNRDEIFNIINAIFDRHFKERKIGE